MTEDAGQPPEYVAEHVRQAIATDPRTSEQGIDVRVVGLDVFLSGEVSSQTRHTAIGEVAAEAAGGHAIHNQVAVQPPEDHHTTEHLT